MSLTPPPSAPPAAPDAPGDAPSRANPSTFRTLADAFVVWQVGFRTSIASLRTWLATYITWAGTHVTELDALQTDVDAKSTAAVGAAAASAHIYPGTYASAPTTRPPEGTGAAIQNGDRYQNSADGFEYVRLSGVWVSALNLQLGSSRVQKTWTELNAITGSVPASAVIYDDSGTHTDPVVGGTVSNSGIYRWVASPAGWERVANTGAAAAAAEYRVYITGAPVPLGGYVASRSAYLSGRMRRFFAEIVGGPCTIQVKVNGVVAHAAINISGTVTQDIGFYVNKGDTVDFWATSGTPTSVWAQIDGATP